MHFVAYIFLIYIDGLLCEIKKHPELGVKFSETLTSSLLFANDFVEIAQTRSTLESLVDFIGDLKPV